MPRLSARRRIIASACLLLTVGTACSSFSGAPDGPPPTVEAGADRADLPAVIGDGGPAVDAGSKRCRGREGTARGIVIEQEYCIDATEVSGAAWNAFVQDTALQEALPQGLPAVCSGLTVQNVGAGALGNSSTEKEPVRNVDYCQASAYCRWAGKRLCGRRRGGVLPLAAAGAPAASEWQNACSGGTEMPLLFPYGPAFDPDACPTSGALARVGETRSCESRYRGVFDMSGNVREWEDACESFDGGTGTRCLVRGGSFGDVEETLRCTSVSQKPDVSVRANLNGIRCCSSFE